MTSLVVEGTRIQMAVRILFLICKEKQLKLKLKYEPTKYMIIYSYRIPTNFVKNKNKRLVSKMYS